jgi:hypothetical protein
VFSNRFDLRKEPEENQWCCSGFRKLLILWCPETGSNRGWPRVSTKTVRSDPTLADRAGELQQ